MSAAQDQLLNFEKKYIAATVTQLLDRAARLSDALEWLDNQDEASSLEAEQRIINATLSAIALEYGPNYFCPSTVAQASAPASGKLTFERAIAAYRALLELRSGEALRIDSDNIAFLLDGALVGYFDGDGVLDKELIYDFDSSAWDDEEGCWAGWGEQTQAAIANPVFIDIPVFS